MSLPYFNSIKVQLKRAARQYRGHEALFQFHKGTIKTAVGILERANNLISIP